MRAEAKIARQPTPGVAEWAQLIAKIDNASPDAMHDLHSAFARGLRYLLARQLEPQAIEDNVRDILLAVANAICEGSVPVPERFPAFVRHIAHRTMAEATDLRLHTTIESATGAATPERVMVLAKRTAVARAALSRLSNRDRQILAEFYLEGQAAGPIGADTKLAQQRFRIYKSRAKGRFGLLRTQCIRPMSAGATSLAA